MERYHTKEKISSGIKTFWLFRISLDKLLYVLNKITDFACKGGAVTGDYTTVYNSGAFWSWPKSKTWKSYSLEEIKSCLEFLFVITKTRNDHKRAQTTTNHQQVTKNHQQTITNYQRTNSNTCASIQKADVSFLLPAPGNYEEHLDF